MTRYRLMMGAVASWWQPRLTLRWLCLVALLGGSAGCGEDRGLVRVSGHVTLDGQPMPGKGYLRFVPLKVQPGYVRRAGMAHFETDGAYQVRSFEPNDGLFPGEYAVFPFCWEVEPQMAGPPARSYLPAKYLDPKQPPFRLTVAEGQGALVFDVKLLSNKAER
jgi:hypothetical protein